jgi:hypothetical protein
MADVVGDKGVGVRELPEPSGTHATFNDPEGAAQDDLEVARVEKVYK